MSFYTIDPISDRRWREFVESHPNTSIFHTVGWLQALSRTYAYEPLVLTPSAGKEISGGQPFCRVNSWLTGKRLVSLPFSDHVSLLLEERNDLQEMAAFLQREVDEKSDKYVEIRPPDGPQVAEPLLVSKTFYLHRLSLKDDLKTIFQHLHPSCVQRKIRRAEREKLDYTEGRSEKLIHQFYRLLMYSRRRYGLPPQPISWFHNLVACLGPDLKIRMACRNGSPICGILTLDHKKTMVYKYGCSDPRQHKLGGMALLFWKTIQEAKNRGFEELDMGRTDCHDSGLIAFKEHWGATRSLLSYLRYPAVAAQPSGESWQMKAAKRLCGMVPAPTLASAGKFLYRHAG